MVPESNLSMCSIDTLGFSPRVFNCLKRAGIKTVGQLQATSEKQLMGLPFFGEKSLNEVREKLKDIIDSHDEHVGDESVDVSNVIQEIQERAAAYMAYDKYGNPIRLGSLVRFIRKLKSGQREHMGIVKEIIFNIDGSTLLRVDGCTSQPVEDGFVELVKLTEREALIIEEFAKRNVRLELSEAQNLAAMLSFPSQLSNDGGGDSHDAEQQEGTA